MLRALRKLFAPPPPPPDRPMLPPDPEPEALVVPEISAEEVRRALSASPQADSTNIISTQTDSTQADSTQAEPLPLLVDVRELYEWRQVRIPPAGDVPVVHIPMSEFPERAHELPTDRLLIVVCAHGSRSYSVAAWLLENGLRACSLASGINGWSRGGGAIEQG
ncbi:MAG: rhodanese-like domain-containing protein [Litorilinea sp.]